MAQQVHPGRFTADPGRESHETYEVPAGGIDAVYNGMPLFGLAKATSHVPVGPGSNTATQRMGGLARGGQHRP